MKRLLLVILFPFFVISMDNSVDNINTTTVGMSSDQIADWCVNDYRDSFDNYAAADNLISTDDRNDNQNDPSDTK